MRVSRVLLCATVLVLIYTVSLCTFGLGQTPKDAFVVSCGKLPTMRELTTPETKSVLAAFGYNLRQPYDCARLTSRWYGASTVLSFRSVPRRLDDETKFAVVFTSREIWVLPIASGMVEYPRVESDPHNLAAFNALLAVQKVPSSAPEWISLAHSYLALIGHEKTALSPKVSGTGGEYTVELTEPQSPDSLIQWTLSFDISDRSVRLQDVSREVQSRK
jgi:hypothetical protein